MNTGGPIITGVRHTAASARRLPSEVEPPVGAAVNNPSAVAAETPAQAWARGFAEGEQRSRQQATDAESRRQREHDAALKALAGERQSVTALRDALQAFQREQEAMAEASLARLTSLAVSRLLCSLAEDGRLAVEIARSVLQPFAGANEIRLCMNPLDLAGLPESLSGDIRIEADDDLPRGSWRVVTAHESIDCAIEQQLRFLDDALRHDTNNAH